MKTVIRLVLMIAVCLLLAQCTTDLLFWENAIEAGKAFLNTGDFSRAAEYFQIAFSKSGDEYEKSLSKAYEAWAKIGMGDLQAAQSLLNESMGYATNGVSDAGRLYALYFQGDYAGLSQRSADIYAIPSDFSLNLSGDTLTKTEIANFLMLGLAAHNSKNTFINFKWTLDGIYSDPLIDEMEAFFF